MKGLTKLARGAENVGIKRKTRAQASDGYAVVPLRQHSFYGADINIVDDECRSWPPVTMRHEVCGWS